MPNGKQPDRKTSNRAHSPMDSRLRGSDERMERPYFPKNRHSRERGKMDSHLKCNMFDLLRE